MASNFPGSTGYFHPTGGDKNGCDTQCLCRADTKLVRTERWYIGRRMSSLWAIQPRAEHTLWSIDLSTNIVQSRFQIAVSCLNGAFISTAVLSTVGNGYLVIQVLFCCSQNLHHLSKPPLTMLLLTSVAISIDRGQCTIRVLVYYAVKCSLRCWCSKWIMPPVLVS